MHESVVSLSSALLASLMTVCAVPQTAFAQTPVCRTGIVYENIGIAVSRERITLAPAGRSVPVPPPTAAAPWAFKNYDARLGLDYGTDSSGAPAVTIVGCASTGKTDTAWCLRSPRVPIPSVTGATWRLTFRLDATHRVFSMAGTNDDYCTGIRWFGADGQSVGGEPFAFEASRHGPTESVATGDVPAGARAVDFQFGFDEPNIGKGQHVTLSDFRLELFTSEGGYRRTGSFVSEVRRGGPIGWAAQTPAGTFVRFQVAVADAAEAACTAPFRGPDGTANSYYEKPFDVGGAFLRYKAFLGSVDGCEAPVLSTVTVGGATEGDWSMKWDDYPPVVNITSPTTTTNAFECLRLSISEDAIVLAKTFRAKVDGVAATDSFVRRGRELVFKPQSAWTNGLHEVAVELADCHGNGCVSRVYFHVGEAPAGTPVTLRDDGVTLVGGSPFFPVGIYAVRRNDFNGRNFDRAFRDLREAGFTCAHSYTDSYDPAFLSAARKFGFRLWMRPGEAKWFLEEGRNNPSVLAWYLGDDTSNFMRPEQLRAANSRAKAVDPTRLTCQADPIYSKWGHSKYADYVTGADVYMPEIYPLRKPVTKGDGTADSCVAEVIRDLRRFKADVVKYGDGKPRACWPIIQYFKGWGLWDTMPNRAQLFAMTWGAVVHGANGMTWYTYGGDPNGPNKSEGVTTRPEYWKNIGDLARELTALSDVLTARLPVQPPVPVIEKGPRKDPLGQPAVTCLLKHREGKSYLFAVNASPAAVRAHFQMADCRASVADVRGENRRVVLDRGFADDFDGFGVHVYTWTQE